MKIIDLTGKVFGRLTVVKRGPNQGRHIQWLCRCSCGKERCCTSTNLVDGKSRSCGCLRIDTITTHKRTKTPEYRTWWAMKSRCYTKNNSAYPYYGQRGVTVCDRWLHSFENFFADMGLKPSSKHSLDRIDTTGNYCPENCRWAIRETQDNNRRDNVRITFDGQTKTVTQWARDKGLGISTLRGRLKWGWPIEDALSFPPSYGRVNPHHIKPI